MDEPNISMRQIRKQISELLSIGERSIHTFITAYNETKTVSVAKQTRKKKSFRDLFDDFSKNAVRRHVHSIWFRREILKIDKIPKPYQPTTVC